MDICGLIVEYNPFHNGHLYHIKKCKEMTNSKNVIAVMSGNFTQRGTPSIVDKWLKTKMALQQGVDLVLELPAVYSLSSAEFFAFGAVSLLNSLGIVDGICFGSEVGNIDILKQISTILINEPTEYKNELKKYLDTGLNYPSSRNKALKYHLIHNSFVKESILDEILSQSNNILGIEYCKSLLKLNSSIEPITIKREGNLYNDLNLNNKFSSASAIRNHFKSNKSLDELKNFMPKDAFNLILKLAKENYSFPMDEHMFQYVKYKILTNENSLDNIPDALEGLNNKIIKELHFSNTLNELILKSKSKRYTYTRISRILTQLFIGFELFPTENMRKSPCAYARVLGFSSEGQKILKLLKNTCSIPVYTKLPRDKSPSLQLDIQCTRAYSLINKNINPNSDYLIRPIIYK
ncbi:nucleotidyltransferase [Clostridium sp. KNHs214]|uniref:nucleotidyltransferase n=1 Tax=Clostridium sp. KNHs214 TaxID=1540257 RepID=UPI0005560958|nr:nucleotidyltransferase [Clostridium sp. KNHs214]